MPARRRRPAMFLAALICWGAVSLSSQNIEEGIDLWVSPPENSTQVVIGLPNGFFNPGSRFRRYTISLQGEPLPTEPGTPSLAPADTVLERLDTAILSCGSEDMIRLRIMALRLVAEQPITVIYSNGRPPEEWDVRVCLSDAPQRVGSLTIRQECSMGGTFTSQFSVRPKFIFTRRSDGLERSLDWLQNPQAAKEVFMSGSGSWARQAPQGFPRITADPGAVTDGNCDGVPDPPLPGTTEDFVVGIQPVPCSCSTEPDVFNPIKVMEMAPSHMHEVTPASQDSRSFPQNRDRRLGAPGRADRVQTFISPVLRGLASLAVLALVLVWLPWRRPPSKPDGPEG